MNNTALRVADSAKYWHSPFGKVDLVWTDPPFGTGKKQSQRGNAYNDIPQAEAVRLTINSIRNIQLADTATVCVLADYRIVHDVIHELSKDLIFRGEVIWTFGLGRPRTDWWPNRHNTIATFTVSEDYIYNIEALPTEKRKAPKPGYPETKSAGSVWDKTMSNTDPERVGYPNQKPLDIITPFILAHTNPGMVVGDPFMGSGATGHAAIANGRLFVGQDLNPEALEISRERLRHIEPRN